VGLFVHDGERATFVVPLLQVPGLEVVGEEDCRVFG